MIVRSRNAGGWISWFAAAAFGLCLLGASPGAASPVLFNFDFTGSDWMTPDINGVGNASWANDGGVAPPKRLRLTSNAGGQRGNVWINSATVEANAAWHAEFDFQITYEHGGGADGLAFHVQGVGVGADTWIEGQGLGANYLSVIIDTWDNGAGCDFGLIVYNNSSQLGGCQDLSGLGSLANDVYRVVMDHDGSGGLSVQIVDTTTTNQTGVFGYTVDLSTLNTATVGWSAQTGGAGENHDVLSMSGTFVPEPGTAILLGLGLVGLGLGRRIH